MGKRRGERRHHARRNNLGARKPGHQQDGSVHCLRHHGGSATHFTRDRINNDDQGHNHAPQDGPAYVLGPVRDSALSEGEYVGMLALSLPFQSSRIKFDSELPLSINGVDGNNVAIATAIDVPRGNSQTFVLHFSQPDTATGTSNFPTGRVKGVSWTYGEKTWRDDSIQKIIYPPET